VRFYNIIGCCYCMEESVAIILNPQDSICMRITTKAYIIIGAYKQAHTQVKNLLLAEPKAL
jgi:hypothetical protein